MLGDTLKNYENIKIISSL